MKDVIYLLFHLLTTIAKLIQPGGSRAVIAENLLLKQQLIIHSRSRQRAPNLTTQDRTVLGFLSLFLNPRRLARSAIIIKPSTLLSFPQCTEETKVSPSVFTSWWQEARAKGTIQGSHQCHRRNEAAQSPIWLSAHRSADQPGFRSRPGQGHRPARTGYSLQTRSQLCAGLPG